jgi:hypothetical protein
MNEVIAVTIPYGFQNNGSWIHQAKMRDLNGYDEQYIASIKNTSLYSTIRTTALLKRVVIFDKAKGESDTEEILRQLTVGDRSVLMLHMRRLNFGDLLQCVITCPKCKENMSTDLSIAKILEREDDATAADTDASAVQSDDDHHHHQHRYSANPSMTHTEHDILNMDDFVLKIRPITGLDEEALLKFKIDDEDKNIDSKSNYYSAQELLVRSCIVSSSMPLPNDRFTENFIASVSSKLAEIDPMADLILDLQCPSCQYFFQTPFSIDDFVFQDISARLQQFEQEVHWLAFNYHWTEDTILSLPIKRRKKYIELINKTLAGEDV